MRICLVYDCLFPYTVGGAERWYRNLAERLVSNGHEVTYVTLRQWDRGERLDLDERVKVVTAGPRMALYTAGGRRRILPPPCGPWHAMGWWWTGSRCGAPPTGANTSAAPPGAWG
jgi:hypothetical protein